MTYNELKEKTFSDYQVPTQCINVQTINKGKNLRSIINRILMQINSKIGGAPWGISDIPFADKPLMVMGISVWKKNQRSKNSILCCTMTTNARLNKYTTICKEQEDQDLATRLGECVTSAIETFQKLNGNHKPKKIVFYRDGVSESQQGTIKSLEIPAIKQAIDDDSVQIAFIVTNKRVSTRYFENKGGRLDTAKPGTAVTSKIIAASSEAHDFFLVSQLSRQGAASPTHYHILFNEFGDVKEELIRLTYKLCYLYFHINAGIKVPAPIQYAERLGALLGDKVNKTRKEKFVLPGDRFLKTPSLFYI